MEYHYEYSRELPVLTNQEIISGPNIPGGFDAYIHEIMGGDDIFGGSDLDIDDDNDVVVVGASDNYKIIRTASTVEPELKELFNYKRLPILPAKKPRRKKRKTKKSRKSKKSVRVFASQKASTSVRGSTKKRKRRVGASLVSSQSADSNNVMEDLQTEQPEDSDSEESEETDDESSESDNDSPFNEAPATRHNKPKDVKQYSCATTGSSDIMEPDDNIADVSFDGAFDGAFDESKQDDYSIMDYLVN